MKSTYKEVLILERKSNIKIIKTYKSYYVIGADGCSSIVRRKFYKDNTYKYQYDNHCLNECPDNTINDTYICKDKYPENSFNTETFHTFFNSSRVSFIF